MDPKQLRQHIEAVAIIKDKKPTGSPSIRPAKEIVIEIDEDGDEVEVEVVVQSNPTLGYEFVKLKPIKKDCELGCGQVVDNQIIEKRLAFTPQKHWRTKCKTCGYFVHPTGLGFVETAHQIQAEYFKWFNKGCPEVLASEVMVKTPHSTKTRTKTSSWQQQPDGTIILVENDNQND
jgi:hypothetical protein